MTRSSPAWLAIGFAIALVGVGFPHWQLAYSQVGLPDSLYGPGLVAVAVVALMLRAFGTARFWKVWLIIAAAVPAAVAVRVAMDVTGDPTSHNLWPFELLIAAALGLAASLAGTLLGSLFLLRSSRRPD
ncbi:hypothetical protein [Pseudoxanthomonas wuyuanensis]|uniref:Uncharacterized protein n=1 Tax=Pseudoxanthomonas wuyuanensis TaxID=1073196 RepID=A0A286D8I4_9GAMM|nr:hypothetical protein [Pseudoxanthomonas wuyuanensis]KAF1720227.1 hypothetical protein CSC75_11695 [Pseudoxanthomonas wuyuanensis]SOD54953.1 hypothetical protein SAMN06296416_105226 [Pseudoxanthomonas wuyuanensis]